MGALALVTLYAVAGQSVSSVAPGLAMIITAVILYAGGRLMPPAKRPVALVLVSSSCVAVLAAAPEMLTGGPTAEPLGYGNANGSFLALGATAAIGAWVLSAGWVRALAAVETGVLLLALPATRSQAATALALAAAILVWASHTRRSARVAAAAIGALVLVAALTVPVALGAGYTGPGASAAESALSTRRVDLWGDAVDLARSHPWHGVGIGSFPQASPTARQDADTRFGHSLTLELAAEGGIPLGSLVVLVLALLVTAACLGATPALGVWAVTVFAAQAGIDYTYRFPAVVLAAAMVVGLASARPARPSPDPAASAADP